MINGLEHLTSGEAERLGTV